MKGNTNFLSSNVLFTLIDKHTFRYYINYFFSYKPMLQMLTITVKYVLILDHFKNLKHLWIFPYLTLNCTPTTRGLPDGDRQQTLGV